MIVAGVEVRRQHLLELASLLTRKDEDVTARNLTTAIVTGKEEVELTEVDRERIVDLLRESPLGLEELRNALLAEHAY
jgi:sulfur transfer complex TusBCD TusB component (DsrH family)